MKSQNMESKKTGAHKQNLQKQEITVANRFIFYYASLVRRIYGMVSRKDGKNIPGTQVTGSLPSLDEDISHGGPVPNPGEVMLFRYRKRLLFGIPENTHHKTVTLWAEDGRRLHVAERGLVHGCRIDAETAEDVRGYARTVRALADEIDLRDVWTLTRDTGEPVGFDEVAGFLWGERVDSTQTAALHLGLYRCPYFEQVTPGSYGALPEAAVRERLQQRRRHLEWEREWDELVEWFSSKETDPYDPGTFTSRQQVWVRNIIDYTLHGMAADKANQTKQLLSQIVAGKKDHQRSGYSILVRKGIWAADENVELLRSGRQVGFPAEVLDASAREGGQQEDRSGRRHRVRSALVLGDGSIALSARRRWWWRSTELGIHLPDVGSWVQEDSVLDNAASDRMGTLRFENESGLDGDVPMLPASIVGACTFGDGAAPAVSLYLTLDGKFGIRSVRVRMTTVTSKRDLTEDDVVGILEGERHEASKALNLLHRATLVFQNARSRAESFREGPPGVASLAEVIEREMGIVAGRCAVDWCLARHLPVMYAAQEAPADAEVLAATENPVLRRHEIRRATSPVSFEAMPAAHAGLGVASICPIAQPLHCYPDLVNLRQISTFLRDGEAVQSSGDLDVIRFRAREELTELDRLCNERRRYRQLEDMQESVGEIFDATVLHVRRDGVLVELEATSLWALVQPDRKVSAGDRLRVRVTGVDLWLRRLRASAVERDAVELQAV